MNRKLIGKVRILLAAGALGVLCAYAIAHLLQLHKGHTKLVEYAGRLDAAADGLGHEAGQAVRAISQDNLPFCSDRELSFLRDYVYRSPHIRDLGQLRDGRLYCSSGVGKLAIPLGGRVPDVTEGNVRIYIRSHLLLSENATGFILQIGDISMVLNPDAYQYLDEPPMFYSVMVRDRAHQRLLPAFGRTIPLTNAEVLAGKFVERDGVFYQPLCPPNEMTCVIGGESRKDMMAAGRPMLAGSMIAGALLGIMIGLMVMQLHQGQLSMESQLRRAIRTGSMSMVYQPIVNLQTGAIVGAEALVRWVNEQGDVVRPEIFVTLAEDRGFISELTNFAAQRMAEELAEVLAGGNFRATLNIASQDLTDPRFFAHLEGCLAAAGIEPSCIGLELTERSTADQKLATEGLAYLKNAGHMVYIDDFGTGYSSLAYLHRLAVDAIKIDQTFTQTVGTGAVTASVVPQILEMAARLDLLVVVEGIETAEQAAYFRAAGRGILGQGWLFGKPVPVTQLRKMLGAQTGVGFVVAYDGLEMQAGAAEIP